jgi:hypothetical protein
MTYFSVSENTGGVRPEMNRPTALTVGSSAAGPICVVKANVVFPVPMYLARTVEENVPGSALYVNVDSNLVGFGIVTPRLADQHGQSAAAILGRGVDRGGGQVRAIERRNPQRADTGRRKVAVGNVEEVTGIANNIGRTPNQRGAVEYLDGKCRNGVDHSVANNAAPATAASSSFFMVYASIGNFQRRKPNGHMHMLCQETQIQLSCALHLIVAFPPFLYLEQVITDSFYCN